MRIECPHCHAVFEVPEALAKGAKRLRCANCGDSWTPGEPAAADDGKPAEPETFEVPADVQDGEEAQAPGTVQAAAPEENRNAPEVSTMASRSVARRAAVLHSRSAGEAPASASVTGPAMIGSTAGWIAAWGASLVVAGAGAALLWSWKLAGVAGAVPGIGHLSSP